MKHLMKYLIAVGVVLLLAGGAYAQVTGTLTTGSLAAIRRPDAELDLIWLFVSSSSPPLT